MKLIDRKDLYCLVDREFPDGAALIVGVDMNETRNGFAQSERYIVHEDIADTLSGVVADFGQDVAAEIFDAALRTCAEAPCPS